MPNQESPALPHGTRPGASSLAAVPVPVRPLTSAVTQAERQLV